MESRARCVTDVTLDAAGELGPDTIAVGIRVGPGARGAARTKADPSARLYCHLPIYLYVCLSTYLHTSGFGVQGRSMHY
jgi:hypothetical protein